MQSSSYYPGSYPQIKLQNETMFQEANNGDGNCNLIINYLPQGLTDQEFYALFATIGPVFSARIIRDRPTGYSYGYGFVKYKNASDAAMAINQLNGMNVMSKYIKVAYSLPSGQENRNINLYVKGLPANTSNDSLRKLFQHLGTIVECRAIPDKITGACQGIGFILFSRREEAETAIEVMNNQTLDGATEPLLVKFSKNEQKKPPPTYTQQYPSQYPLPQAGGPMRGAMPFGGFRGMGNMRGRNVNRYSPMTGPGYGFMASSPSPAPFQQQQQGGGFIVFVYGIGPFTTEHTLWQLCSPYGEIKRVNVIKDHAKGQGKGYGFVTYGTLDAANYAIQSLNGTPYEGKVLQVSLKS